MSKRRKRKAKRGSVAGATRKRREAAAQGDGPSFLTLPEGVGFFALKSTKTARVDIIPYVVGKGNPRADKGVDYWERTFYIHRNVGPNNDWVVCPARTTKKKCPICEFVNTLREDEDGNETLIKALNTSRRMIMNVIDMSEDKGDRPVRVMETSHAYFGKAMDEALTSAYEDDEDNMDGFCDAVDGNYLKMVVEKGYLGKGYSVERIDFKSRKEDLDDEILDAAVCLDDILIIKDYDDLKELLLQDDSDDDEDEPKSKKKKRKSRKKKDEEDSEFDDEDEDEEEEEDEDEDEDEDDSEFDEDEDEDDSEFDDDDEEEEEDEDEDEDEDSEFDDDDEEEEKPKRKKKKVTKKKTTKKKTTKKKTTTKKKRGRKSRK